MLSTEERTRILSSVNADHGFMKEFVDDFLTDVPQDIAALERAISTQDAEGTERAAHGLKSVVGLFQAMGPYEIARDIESLGKEGDFTAARSKFNELVPAIDDLKSLLASAF